MFYQPSLLNTNNGIDKARCQCKYIQVASHKPELQPYQTRELFLPRLVYIKDNLPEHNVYNERFRLEYNTLSIIKYLDLEDFFYLYSTLSSKIATYEKFSACTSTLVDCKCYIDKHGLDL